MHGIFLTQAIAKHILLVAPRRLLSLLPTTSVSAEMVSVECGPCLSSKAALVMQTKLFFCFFAQFGVFEFSPGVICKPLTSTLATQFDRLIADRVVSAGRRGAADDVADTAAVLAFGLTSPRAWCQTWMVKI